MVIDQNAPVNTPSASDVADCGGRFAALVLSERELAPTDGSDGEGYSCRSLATRVTAASRVAARSDAVAEILSEVHGALGAKR